MRIIIIRHGETEENIKGICMGHTPGHLSEIGIRQVNLLAYRLKDIKISKIYSSDLQRAVDTAQKILKFHLKLKLKLDKRLRERFYGNMQGKFWSDNFNLNKLPFGIEDNTEMFHRAKSFMEDVLCENQQDSILIICHGGIKKMLLTVLHKLPLEKFNDWEKIKNTAVSEFEINNEKIIKTVSLNCVKHL